MIDIINTHVHGDKVHYHNNNVLNLDQKIENIHAEEEKINNNDEHINHGNKKKKHQKNLSNSTNNQTIQIQNKREKYFSDALQSSKKSIPQIFIKEIFKYKKKIEDRVYNLATTEQDPNKYLNHLYNKQVNLLSEQKIEIETLLASKLKNVENDINENKIEVYKKKIKPKQELYNNQQKNMDLKILKIKEGELREKIQNLKGNINRTLDPQNNSQSQQDFNLFEHKDQNQITSKNLKGLQLQDFLKKINRQKQQLRKKKEEAKKRQIQEQIKLQRLQQQLKLQYKIQKREKLFQKIQQRQEKKLKEQKKKEEIKQFLNQYKPKKPLYKVKQQQYIQKIVLPEYQKKQAIIQQIKQQHKHIDVQQLNIHQKNYLQQMLEHKFEKAQQVRLMKQEEKKYNKYFKGRFRYLVLEQMVKQKQIQDPRQQQKQKRLKKNLYGQKVKQQFAPKIDIEKRKELQSLIEKKQFWKQKKRLRASRITLDADHLDSLLESGEHKQVNQQLLNQEFDSRKDGIKNLQQLHKLIQVYKKEGKIKKPKDIQSVSLEPKKDYLKQFRQKREQAPKTARFRISQKKENIEQFHQFEKVKMKAQLIDEKVKQKQRYLRNNKNLSPIEGLQVGNKLQQDYLQSIKTKIAILNKKQ